MSIRFDTIKFSSFKEAENFLNKEEILYIINEYLHSRLLAAAVARHMRLATKLTNHLNKEPEDDNQNL